MNANSLKRAFTKGLHLFFIATLIAGWGIFSSEGLVYANANVSIVDTLGAATPATQFSVFGAGGVSIFGGQFAGPEFTLTQPTVLTEIGGFVNNCDSIVSGVPQCPTTLPFTVQIRPSMNGVPDASTVLASFALSHDNNPLVVSYESVAINLTLQAGTYFALFAAQGNDGGFLLGGASDPFSYLPGTINMGLLFPTTGASSTQGSVPRAVRILGEIMTGFPSTSVLDNFNRPKGRLGPNWLGGREGYKIANQQVKIDDGGLAFWKPDTFGADQEAFVTLAKVDREGRQHGLLLKAQGTHRQHGVILVFYRAREHKSGQLGIQTFVPGQGWKTLATFEATLRNGDQLGGRSLVDGVVQVYVNGELIGEANAGSFFVGKGGRIGLWFKAEDARLDDFGGGTIMP